MGTRLITTGTVENFAVGDVTWTANEYRTPDFKLWSPGKSGDKGFVCDRLLAHIKTGTTALATVLGDDFEVKIAMIPEIGAPNADEVDMMIGRFYGQAAINTTPTPDVVDWFLLLTGAGAFNEYLTMKEKQLDPSGSVSENAGIITLPFARFVFQKGDHTVGDIEASVYVAG